MIQEKNPERNHVLQKEDFLKKGFIDADTISSVQLESQLIGKTVSAVYYNAESPKVIADLQLEEFADLKGYGFRLPEGNVLLVSRYDRTLDERASGWLFKID